MYSGNDLMDAIAAERFLERHCQSSSDASWPSGFECMALADMKDSNANALGRSRKGAAARFDDLKGLVRRCSFRAVWRTRTPPHTALFPVLAAPHPILAPAVSTSRRGPTRRNGD